MTQRIAREADGSDRRRGRMLICFALVALLVGAAGVARADLAGLDGDTLREASLADGTTVVVVWASWSPRCREIVEQVNALQDKWGNKARVVTVNFQEEPAAARAFLQGKGLKVPVYLDTDGAFSKKHAVTWLPGLIVFQGGDAPFKGRFAADADATIGRFVQ